MILKPPVLSQVVREETPTRAKYVPLTRRNPRWIPSSRGFLAALHPRALACIHPRPHARNIETHTETGDLRFVSVRAHEFHVGAAALAHEHMLPCEPHSTEMRTRASLSSHGKREREREREKARERELDSEPGGSRRRLPRGAGTRQHIRTTIYRCLLR